MESKGCSGGGHLNSQKHTYYKNGIKFLSTALVMFLAVSVWAAIMPSLATMSRPRLVGDPDEHLAAATTLLCDLFPGKLEQSPRVKSGGDDNGGFVLSSAARCRTVRGGRRSETP